VKPPSSDGVNTIFKCMEQAALTKGMDRWADPAPP
jgi:hypothetical protein